MSKPVKKITKPIKKVGKAVEKYALKTPAAKALMPKMPQEAAPKAGNPSVEGSPTQPTQPAEPTLTTDQIEEKRRRGTRRLSADKNRSLLG
jgi:hypothetical protein